MAAQNNHKFAVLSDIHSNLEALTTVLADIKSRDIGTIYCLGDVVGYGPNPKECLDLIIEKVKWCVLGNHDYGVFYEPTNFNYAAEQASFWTREVMETEQDKKRTNKWWNFLGNMSMRNSITISPQTCPAPARSAVTSAGGKPRPQGPGLKENQAPDSVAGSSENQDSPTGPGIINIDFVHASPRKPVNEYIFPDDVYTNPAKVKILFERVSHICFVGHTHMPGVFLDEPDFYLPDELNGVYPIVEDEKAIINIGSVGQPRDKDNRASYVYVQDSKVHFVRLEYDFETTAEKIVLIDELDNFNAERLRDGR